LRKREALIGLAPSRQARDSREPIKSFVEGQYSLDAVLFHHCQMYGIACRQSPVPKNNLFGALYYIPVNGENFIDGLEYCVEGRLDIMTAIDSAVTMQNLLQDFRICDQALALAQQLFQHPLRIRFLRSRSAYQVHRDIRVDQDQGW